MGPPYRTLKFRCLSNAEGSCHVKRWRHLLSEREEGFTLVELVVAMFVLAIVLVAIITVQSRALMTTADSQTRQEATAMANESMEELRSMPWNILKKGLASNYKTAAGGDPFVAGSTLTLNGTSYTLKVATSGGSDQVLASPWTPLFSNTGSNKQVRTDPSGNGSTYTVRAYTVEDPAGKTDAVGLVVAVTWSKKTNGTAETTVLTSTAYAPTGGCGNLNDAPFLASCQAQLYALSNAGNIVVTASANDSMVVAGNTVAGPNSVPLLPNAGRFTAQMSTSVASSRIANQQVSNVDAYATNGGVQFDDNDSSTQPVTLGWSTGFESVDLKASDDPTAGAAPKNPTDLTPSSNPTTMSFSAGSGLSMSFESRADDLRTGTADASVTQACATGITATSIPAGNPCAHATYGASTSTSTYMNLNVDGAVLQLTRVFHGAGNDSVSHAWGGRFATVAGTASTGCVTVSGAGCVSGGAQRTVGEVNVGSIAGGWTGGKASNGLVRVAGYSEQVLAQRGVNQKSTAATFARSGSVLYWNGSSYSTIALSATTNSSVTTGTVTWESANTSVVAVGHITITPAQQTTAGADASCKTAACDLNASNGNITIGVTYLITPKSGAVPPFVLSVSTQVNGATAAASFRESPNA